jgi:hypothetical protein
MRLSTKLFTASASALILGGASAQAQTVLINQNGGDMTLGNSNEAILKNNGTGAVNLQAFQDVANTVNKGTAVYNLNLPVGTVTQNLGAGATSGGVNFNSSNLNGTFSALGPQTTSGSQGINTNVNNATLGLSNNAAVSILQSSIGQSGPQDGITANQSNVMSAGYQNSPAAGVPFPTPGGQYIGNGPAFIQGQSFDANGNIVNNGFQNNSFTLNTANIVAGGNAASVSLGQKPGDIDAVLTNFADAGVATPGATPVDPSIKNMNQLVNGKVNQLNSSGPANSTLTLDGTGQTGFQVVGTPVTPVGATTATPVSQDFVVQNAARALTWANQPTVTPTLNTPATWSPSQGGAGNVEVKDTTQTVDLGFNGIVAGTTAAPVNVDFGGRSGGQFDQIAQYGTYQAGQSDGITISNVAQPGAFPTGTPPINNSGYPTSNNDSVVSPQYASTPIQGMLPISTKLSSTFPATVNQPYASFVDGAVNASIAGTGDGAATLANVNQAGLARFNTASVTGTVAGNFGQEANINTDGVTGSAPTALPNGNGPAVSNFATAAVTRNGPATMNNVDQTSATVANALYSGGVSADGLRLTQTGYKTASYGPVGTGPSPSSTFYPEASTNVVLADAGPLPATVPGAPTVGGPIMTPASTSGNATIRPTSTSTAVVDGSNQVSSDTFNVFSTGASAGTIELNQTLTPTPVASAAGTAPIEYLSAPSGFGGVNAAGAIAPGSNATLKNGTQQGLVAVNAASIGAASGNTEIFQNASTTGKDMAGNDYLGSTIVAGQNYAVAAGQTGNITNYRQSYASSINSAEVAGAGARYVEQNSGVSTIDLSNNMGATSLNGSATGTSSIAGATQLLSSDVNKASLNNIGTLNQTSGTTISNLANRATTTTATQSETSITGLVQSSSQSVNTNTGM